MNSLVFGKIDGYDLHSLMGRYLAGLEEEREGGYYEMLMFLVFTDIRSLTTSSVIEERAREAGKPLKVEFSFVPQSRQRSDHPLDQSSSPRSIRFRYASPLFKWIFDTHERHSPSVHLLLPTLHQQLSPLPRRQT